MDEMDLSEFFNTKPQAEDFAARMQLISAQIFEMSFNPQSALLDHFGIKKKDAFMTLMRNNDVNGESRKAIKEFIDKIQIKISSLPVLSLVMAFEPKEETLQLLSRWFLINTKKQMLFDIKVDPALIAGAAIMSNGKYLDFSVRPAFERVFKEMTKPPVTEKEVVASK